MSAPAIFWDGKNKLPGNLELSGTELKFYFDDFRHSHLELCIKLTEIEEAGLFLLFDFANHGLKIKSKGGKVDLFILEDSKSFHETLLEYL